MSFSENRTGTLVYLTSSNIGAAHAFTTRLGGVSSGIYTSLNLGQNVGDNPESVRRNYEILGTALGFDPNRLAFSHQVHGVHVRLVTGADMTAPLTPVPYEADGLVTAETDVPLMIFTADCVPILLHDPVRSVIGAVHAGWRGTVRDITGNAIKKMTCGFGCHPSDIRVSIGPCISQCCFETGDDVKAAVYEVLGRDASHFITTRGEKYLVDLKGINSLLLGRAGVRPEHIEISQECTSCSCDKFWSHRVTNGQRGSQASVIMLKGSMN